MSDLPYRIKFRRDLVALTGSPEATDALLVRANAAASERVERVIDKHQRGIVMAGWLLTFPEVLSTVLPDLLAAAWDEGHQTPWKREPDDCRCGAWSSIECGCGHYGTGRITTPNPYRQVLDGESHGRRFADHDWVTFTSSDGRRLTRRCSRCSTEWDSARGAK